MFNFDKGRNLIRRFKENEAGNMTLTFAISAIAVIGCMGAAMDFSTLSNAKARSQAIADQTALAAAVFVSTHGREPNPPQPVGPDEVPGPEEGFLDSSYRVYSAAELGYEFKGFVDGGAENVTVTVDYDGELKEAVVTVEGSTVPTFMQILGQQGMDFKSESTAKYDQFEMQNPASVLMVLDNSGSMAFNDKPQVRENGDSGPWVEQDGSQPRITALQSHAGNFMTTLQDLVGDQSSNDDKVLRTGMLAYNLDTITARTVHMNWQTAATKGSIDQMVANGGTNSAPPMDTSRIWMNSEDQIHENMHGEDPLKFLIFMTDGINTDDSVTWVAQEGTGQWRGYVRTCWGWWCWTERDTVEQEDEPNYGWDWEEGKWDSTANILTHNDCEVMKNSGVKIYTIGFALAEGRYHTNGYFGDNRKAFIDEDVRNKAYSFLSDCATGPETFLTAENSDQLEEAFTRIGQDIQTEIIRLAN